MARKLLLVNPRNRGRGGLAETLELRYQPLALGIVAAHTPAGWEIELADENFERFRHRDADLVGLTAMTATAPRAYEIAALYRARGIPTVLGGIHASMVPEEALQHVDCVVVGEAESAWARVIADFVAGKLKRTYRGEWTDLAGAPHPRRDLFHPGYTVGSIQTTRGCPFDCEFCSVPTFNGRHYRRRPVAEVLDELETVPQGVVCFVDDNLMGYGAGSAERSLELFRGIVGRGIRRRWFCNASMNLVEEDAVMAAAFASGCRLVFVGVEAESVAALEEMNKRANLRVTTNAYQEGFRRIHSHGILVMGAFVYGLDADAPEDLERRTEYILRSGVDLVQLTPLTPLPGTRLFERLREEDRLLFTDYPADWSRYDFTEVVYRPRRMAPGELERCFLDAASRIYSRRHILLRSLRALAKTRSPLAAFTTFESNGFFRKVFTGVVRHRRQPAGA